MFPSATYLNLAGWLHLGLFGVVLPILAVCNRKKVLGSGRALPDRLHHFRRTALEVGMFAICSLVVARAQRIGLFPLTFPPLAAVIAGVVAYAAAVAYMRPNWRRAVERRARVVHLFMPS